MAAIIASVEPHVTVTFVLASTQDMPYRVRYWFAMASRKNSAPHVIGYWLMSAAIAARAASLISSGAAKSGKPCDRLIAPCSLDNRVISRMTDSVNDDALREGRIFDIV